MKKIAVVLIVLLVGLGGFVLWRYLNGETTQKPVTAPVEKSDLGLEVETLPGKALILLVDGTEVYCAKDNIPKDGLEEYVLKTMELNRLKHVQVSGTATARFGEVVALVDRLKKEGHQGEVEYPSSDSVGLEASGDRFLKGRCR